ncbi:YveK family protein [Priestia megaterium]|uniref:YveK family protein n=1 Tax=Priestia megaterium TaxID=1404 RepID=UPI003458A597
MEETINLRNLFQVLRKRLWLIILVTVTTAIVGSIVTFFVLTPVYESKTQILVNQAKSEQQLYNQQTVQTNVQLISTYNDIIKSPAILDKVIKKLQLNVSPQTLSSQIQVTNAQNSQVAQITVQDTNAKRAIKIANTTASVFKDEVPKIMNVNNVSILSKATAGNGNAPVKPQPFINIAIALMIGLIIGIVLSFVLDLIDNTVKTEQDIETILELPVMGTITNIKEVPKTTNVAARAPLNNRASQRGETYGS